MAFSLFQKARGPAELAVDMVGVRLGERLLQVGTGLPRVFAILAGKAGLTGRACAVAADDTGKRVLDSAASAEGVFAEVFTTPGMAAWPFDDASFDVAVVDADLLLTPESAEAVVSELRRSVRPGGRIVALHQRPRGPLVRLGFEGRHGARSEAVAIEALLGRAGFKPVRVLGEREGLMFVEGFRGL
jgi:SAM-dependent methyltransferase